MRCIWVVWLYRSAETEQKPSASMKTVRYLQNTENEQKCHRESGTVSPWLITQVCDSTSCVAVWHHGVAPFNDYFICCQVKQKSVNVTDCGGTGMNILSWCPGWADDTSSKYKCCLQCLKHAKHFFQICLFTLFVNYWFRWIQSTLNLMSEMQVTLMFRLKASQVLSFIPAY